MNFAPSASHGMPWDSSPNSSAHCSQGGLSTAGKRVTELLAKMPDLPDYLISRLKMPFKNVDKALEFYNRYARHAGFGIRKTGGNDNRKYFVCAFQGKYNPIVSEADRKRNKTSSRTGCNARMRLKV